VSKIKGSFTKVSTNAEKTLHCKSHCTLIQEVISNKARNGSIETLIDASIIQSIPAAKPEGIALQIRLPLIGTRKFSSS
jgi:hypothetical protein